MLNFIRKLLMSIIFSILIAFLCILYAATYCEGGTILPNNVNISFDPISVDIIIISADLDQEIIIKNQLGDNIINLEECDLIKYHLPNHYYGNIDFYSFQAYMSYKAITSKSSSAYKVVHSNSSYTDEFGFRRYKTSDDQFTINDQDDYIVAIGNYYKEKRSCGDRFLIITDQGMYTIIAGDEKSDNHTDKLNMFTTHGKGKVNIIEFIVDTKRIEKSVKRMGTVTASSVKEISGKILYIYKIV